MENADRFSDLLDHISLDCVVFGFHENQMKVLLLRMKFSHEWALPGGFVHEHESLEIAADRVLKERTGLSRIFLQQFHVFSDPLRSKHNPAVPDVLQAGKFSGTEWFNQRFISVGFYALVDFSKVEPKPDELSDVCTWVSLDEIEKLMMDHRQILDKALETLRLHLALQPVGLNLLPEKFTMPQLQKLYETILGKGLDRRNFQRKMLGYGILTKLAEVKTGGPHKAPALYKFDQINYQKALKEGLSGRW
jgi:ADP-ribose pyrophosphatase YjhB (NUDIX family)